MIPDLAALLVPKTTPVPTAVEAQSWPDAFAAFLQELSPEVVREPEPEALPETEVPVEETEVAEVQPRFQTVTELHFTAIEPQPKDRPATAEVTEAPVEDAPLPDAPDTTEVIAQPLMPAILPIAPQPTPQPVSSDASVAPEKLKSEIATIVLPQLTSVQQAPQFQTGVQNHDTPDAAPLSTPAPVNPKPAKSEQSFEPIEEIEIPLPIAAKNAAAEIKSPPTPLSFVPQKKELSQSDPAPQRKEPAQVPEVQPQLTPVPVVPRSQELPVTEQAPLPKEPTLEPKVQQLQITTRSTPKPEQAEPLDIAEAPVVEDPVPLSIQPTTAPDRPIHQPERTHAQPHIEPRQIAQQLAVVVREQPEGVTEIALSPDELGSVKMQVTVQNDSVTVVIATEKPETGELMRRHLDTLSQEFRDLGYRDVNLGFSQGSRQQTPQGQPAAVIEPEPEPETQTTPTDGVDIRL